MLKQYQLKHGTYLLTMLIASSNLISKEAAKPHQTSTIHKIGTVADLGKYKPVVIKFASPNCGACRMIAKTYESLANQNPKINFLEVDGTKSNELVKKYKVSAFPTFVFLQDPAQKPTQVVVGADKEKLTAAVKTFAESASPTKVAVAKNAPKDIKSLDELEQTVKKAPKLVVAEYHAEAWCPACKMFVQPFLNLAEKFTDIIFVKIDDMVTGNKEIAKKHKITALPTTLIFMNGNTNQPVEIVVGGSPDKLEAAIQKQINPKAAAKATTSAKSPTDPVVAKPATTTTPATTATNTLQIITSQEQFAELLKTATMPVVAEYHAEAWCGACKVYKSIFEKMATDYPKLKFVKIDHDLKANQAIATTYGVGAFPTTLIFQSGKLIKSIVGINLPEIEKALKAL